MLSFPLYTFNQNGTWQLREQYCVSETTPSCLAFSSIFKQTEAFDFDTSDISVLLEKCNFLLGLEKGDFLLGPCICFQQPIQKGSVID